MDENRSRALAAALSQIEKQFGKGSIMRLGASDVANGIEAGEGLLSMRQRAKKIGSELIITSSAGTGTTVQLRAPLVEKLL